MNKAEQEKTGLTGRDKSQADLRGVEPEIPEGLTRPRKGPVDKKTGRLGDDTAVEASPEGAEAEKGRKS